ncbi:MAG: zinc ribbon domain-containing protein [Pseudomonadota bacterium]
MPIYEYKCDDCDHRLEKLQKISDDPIKSCPECGEETLRKLVSAAAFKLKGTGWYETDFKDKKPKKDDKKSGTKKTESKASSDTTKKAEKNDSKKASTSTTSRPTSKASDT